MPIRHTLFAVFMLFLFYDFFSCMVDGIYDRNVQDDEYQIIMPMDKWIEWRIREAKKNGTNPLDLSKE